MKRRRIRQIAARADHGATLVELMMALVILAIGLLAVNQLFPAGTRAQTKARMMASASGFVQQKVEQLSTLTWADADLSLGRHPSGGAVDSLGDLGSIRRYYQVDTMPIPLDNLRKITVQAYWMSLGDTLRVQTTTYVRR